MSIHATDETISSARSVRIEDELARRGIKLTGKVERAGPCPVCGGTDRFSINTRKQVFNCRGCAKGGDIIALVQHLDCRSFRDAVGTLTGRRPPTIHEQRPRPQPANKDTGNTARALAIWNEAQHPCGTLVEAYFAHRRLTLPDEAAGEAIRFHPDCPFKGTLVPAMVALVRDVITNQPKAIHRTALDAEGRKAWIDGNDRLSLGPVSGGAVKLTPDEDVTLCLGIGEGIESALSLRLAREFGMSPVWSLLSAGQVKAFPVLAGIEALWIAVDHDRDGVKAATVAARAWHRAGPEAFLIKPHAADTDLNDIIQG
jgi:putative DNA primase/helicase